VSASGLHVATIRRDDTKARRAGLSLRVRTKDQRWEEAAELWLMEGLFRLEDLPPGTIVTALSDTKTTASEGEILLLDASGQAVTNSTTRTTPALPLRWGDSK
jgi:hypothetical protein